ncbi:MAG: HAMP domain-containing histidine kinase [Alphaproteobacteria bacterium]|nr:HAMP domain-containing histidine kinase [Alphaproteobacteria bacterium]
MPRICNRSEILEIANNMAPSDTSDDDRAAGRPPQGEAESNPVAAEARRMPQRRSYIQKMAHELKTPISAIVSASEIMRDEQLGPIGDARYRGYVADIHDSARLMLAVIDRMLEHRGREPTPDMFDFAEIDPLELLHATVSSMLPLAERARIRLKLVEAEEQLPNIIADSVAVRQMLINLMTNSLKFTQEGGEIVARATIGSDRSVTFEVRDNGPGMDQKQINDGLGGILAEGEKRQGGGLGVGLPLVQSLATANGARFELQSEPGKGTAARIIFPKAQTTAG